MIITKLIFLSIAYPNFPTGQSIQQELINIILWIIEIPVIAIANVFITIFSYIGNSAGSSAGEIIAFPGQIFQQTENSFRPYGIFAMPISAAIWGISIIILIFFIFKALQIGGDEMTNEE